MNQYEKEIYCKLCFFWFLIILFNLVSLENSSLVLNGGNSKSLQYIEMEIQEMEIFNLRFRRHV